MSLIDWQLAFRNLLRNRRRSLSTLIALAIGLSAILLFRGFQANLSGTMLTHVIRSGGHLQIQHRDFLIFGGGSSLAYTFDGHEALLAAVRADPVIGPRLAVATPVLRFAGLAGNFEAGISRTVLVSGYMASEAEQMRRWFEPGTPPMPTGFRLSAGGPDAAVLGEGLARVLQVCEALQLADCPKPAASTARPAAGAAMPGDLAALAADAAAGNAAPGAGGAPGTRGARIELLATGARGAPNVVSLQVVAAENQAFKELDDIAAVMHLDSAQKLVFGRGARKVTSLVLTLQRTADTALVQQQLETLLQKLDPKGQLAVRSFRDLNPFFVQSEKMFDFIFAFIFVLIGGIVVFTIGNTMSAAVMERTTEIGTLRSMGHRAVGIRRLFLIEGFLLGVGGVLLGVVLAALMGLGVNLSGITWLPAGTSQYVPLAVQVFDNPARVAAAGLALVVVSCTSAWFPARRASSLRIVEALRHV